MRRLAAIAFFLIGFNHPAMAQASCVDAEAFLQFLRSKPGTVSVERLSGDALARGIAIFSAMPPESDPSQIGEMAIVEYSHGEGGVLAGPAGKFCGMVKFDDPAHLRAFRRASSGVAI